jgi:hypothetical protein
MQSSFCEIGLVSPPEEEKLQPKWCAEFPVKKAEKEITIRNRRELDAKLAKLVCAGDELVFE